MTESSWLAPNPTPYGTTHSVSSGHYLASAAAFAILEAGGNAVDAGCCAGMALAVLHADEVNFAGAPIMIRAAEGDTVSIDVAGAALRLGRDGFAALPLLVDGIAERQAGYRRWQANAAICLPAGRPPEVGERFVQTHLAHTIELMIAAEQAAEGGRTAGLEAARAVFYEGEIADAIVAHHEENGGYLRNDDLAEPRSRYEPVVATRWRDFTLYSCGAWIAVRDDGSVLPFGCPGGDMQVQAMLQVFLNAFHFGMPMQEAVNAPRFSTWSFPNSFAPFDYLASYVFLEDRFDASVYAELERRGHDVRRWPAFTRDVAAVEAIYRSALTGFLESAADPRQPAQAVVA